MKRVKSVKPLGYRVLIKPDPIERMSPGGIVIPEPVAESDRTTAHTGTVQDVGDSCWRDTYNGVPWCKIGDRVIIAKHHGIRVWDIVTGKYRDDILLVNDVDILAVITEEEEINGT